MSAIRARWQQWAARFAALSRRERLILCAAAILGGGILAFNFGIDPLMLRARQAGRSEAAARVEMARLQAEALAFKSGSVDPDAARKQRLAQVRAEYGAISERLAAFEAGMVPPAKMQAFLERLMARNGAVELVGLKTLPVTRLGAPVPVPPAAATAKAEAAPASVQATVNALAAAGGPVPAAAASAPAAQAATQDDPADGIFQHGIEIQVAGSYADLLRYVEDIERSPQRVMWHSLGLTADKYPRNILVLRVYTLSLDRKWLTV